VTIKGQTDESKRVEQFAIKKQQKKLSNRSKSPLHHILPNHFRLIGAFDLASNHEAKWKKDRLKRSGIRGSFDTRSVPNERGKNEFGSGVGRMKPSATVTILLIVMIVMRKRLWRRNGRK
jgi:hypothetical protein